MFDRYVDLAEIEQDLDPDQIRMLWQECWALASPLRSNGRRATAKLMAAHCEFTVNPENTPMNIAEDFKKAGEVIAVDTETAMAPRAFEGRDCVRLLQVIRQNMSLV